MNELWRVLRDPKVSTALAVSGIVVAGFVMLQLGWRGAAATLVIPFQVPYLISGGMIGIALVGIGLALLNTHVERTEAAVERETYEQLQRTAMQLLHVAAGQAAEVPRQGRG